MTNIEIVEKARNTVYRHDPDEAFSPEELGIISAALGIARIALRDHKTNGWISVKDRLPEIGEKVLTLDKWGHIHDRTLYQFDGIPTTLFRPDGLAPGKDITHWRPLSEPPQSRV